MELQLLSDSEQVQAYEAKRLKELRKESSKPVKVYFDSRTQEHTRQTRNLAFGELGYAAMINCKRGR